jgi:hypothetical protein
MNKTRELTEDDTIFLSNYTRWTCGPTFDVYFYCNDDTALEMFEQALFSDPIIQAYQGPEHPQKHPWLDQCILLRPAEWPVTLGARYVKCSYTDSRQNHFLLVFYPYHVKRLCGGELWDEATRHPVLVALFMKHVALLTARIAQQIQAHHVIMCLDGDTLPSSQQNGIMLQTWLTQIGQWPTTQAIDDRYSLISVSDILKNPPQEPPVCVTSVFREIQRRGKEPQEPWDGKIVGYIFPKAQTMWDALGADRQLEYLTHIWCPTCTKNSSINGVSVFGDRERKLTVDGGCVYCNSQLVLFIEMEEGSELLQTEQLLASKSKIYAVDTQDFTKDTNTVFAEYEEKIKAEHRKLLEGLRVIKEE